MGYQYYFTKPSGLLWVKLSQMLLKTSLQEVNKTLITLIPKIPNPNSFKHFRLISLCNVVYKIIAKILVARLRSLLHKLISPCQSAFIPGWWIAENEVVV